jgi:hypothetical protein
MERHTIRVDVLSNASESRRGQRFLVAFRKAVQSLRRLA